MGAFGDKSKNRNTKVARTGPGLGWKIWRFVLDHPKGVLIGAATLLGLIVVFQNWTPTTAYLLVAPVKLPFIVWAMVFMVVGYATGKWIEWGWRQRKIRRGTYKPKVSAEDLAETAAALDERRKGEGGAERSGARTEPVAGAVVDVEDPATMLDRGGPRAGRSHDRPVERVDYFSDAGEGGGPRGKLASGERGSVEPGGRIAGGFSPAAEQAAQGSGPAPRYRKGEGGRYADYGDHGAGPRREGRRDSAPAGGRYADYGDAGRYADYGDEGRYGDYDDGRRYDDYGDYADRADGEGARGQRRRDR